MTTPQFDDTKLARIRKLLDKAADSATTPEESLLYEKKAEELLARYGWERAMLPSSEREAEKVTYREFHIQAPYADDKRFLLTGIGGVFGCSNIFWKRKGQPQRVRLYGFASDLERVEILFTSLQLQAVSGMRNAERPIWEPSPITFNKSWLAGFRGRVTARLHELNARLAEEYKGSGAELVIVDRKAQVELYFEQEHPGLKVRKPYRPQVSGYYEGVKAGDAANLSQTSLGGHKRALSS